MQITVQRSVGATVYFMEANKVKSTKIEAISLTVTADGQFESYRLEEPFNSGSYLKEMVFDSKDALLASL